MNRKLLALMPLLVCMVVTLLVIAPKAYCASTEQRFLVLIPQMKTLLSKQGQFLEHVRDFKEYGLSYPFDIDRATGLFNEAARAADVLESVNLSLYVYVNMTIADDRSRVRPMIQESFARYIRRLDTSISVVNVFVSNTQSASIATSAAKMKDDIREAMVLLGSLDLP